MTVIHSFAHWLLAGLAWLFLLVIGGLSLLWALGAPLPDWLRLVNVFAFWLFAPLALLLPAALLLRSPWLRAATLAAGLVFLLSFGELFAPRPVAPPAGRPLRLATFNLLYANEDTAAVITTLRAFNADIITLQELSEPLAAALDEQLATDYPYRALEPEVFDLGIGVLSRYPLEQIGHAERFRGQQLLVDVEGRQINLFNVHLPAPDIDMEQWELLPLLPLIERYDTSAREQGAEELLRLIEQTSGPLIVMGDFNTGDREPLYRRFAARLTDVFRRSSWGPGFTFPTRHTTMRLPPLPLVRIDYVWVSRDIVPAGAQVVCEGESDHCALTAEVRF